MTLGTRRYLSMMVDEAMLSIVTGTPPRAAVQEILARALSDQAKVAEIVVGSLAIKEGEGAVQDWFSRVGQDALRIARPCVGVGDEIPMPVPIGFQVFSMPSAPEGGDAEEGGAP